jgi:hypothetical protein
MDLKLYEGKIVVVRNQEVMLDDDAAEALKVETKHLNENSNTSAKCKYLRDIGVEDKYRFQLTEEEYTAVRMRSTGSTTSRRADNLPWAYTRLGCAFFGTSMNNVVACQLAIQLSEVFVAYTTGKLTLDADKVTRPFLDDNAKKLMQAGIMMELALPYAKAYFEMSMFLGNPESIARANTVQNLHAEFNLNCKGMLSNNIASVQDTLVTATELGKLLGGISAQKVNKMLAEHGLQFKVADEWERSKEGEQYGIILDVGKKRSSGTAVQQIKWYKNKTITFLEGKCS